MNQILIEISKAIKQGKWLNITYQNQQNEKTYFWCAIKDIDANTKTLKVDLFNIQKSQNIIIDATIYINQIQSAQTIEATYYPIQLELIKKIKAKKDIYAFLAFIDIDERILDYYLRCYYEDTVCYVKDFYTLDGIDIHTLLDTPYILSNNQFEKMIQYIKINEKEKKQNQLYSIALNELSIIQNEKLYPIVYRQILLDIEKKEIICSKEPMFNIHIEDNFDKTKFHLQDYLEIQSLQFIEQYHNNPQECIDILMQNLKPNEKIEENPYLFEIKRKIPIPLEKEYNNIKQNYQNNTLSYPLQTFFGIKNKHNRKANIIILDHNINLEQLTVVYNALSQDITYVQGPPGTGKTQTILNVIISHLINKKTVCITSNNNEAIQNIYQKLQAIEKNMNYPLPILRLGNNTYIKNTLNQMKEHMQKQEQKENKVTKKELENHIQSLNEMIKIYESQKELEEKIEVLKECIVKMEKDPFSKIILEAELEQLKQMRTQIPSLSIPQINPSKTLSYLRDISISYLKEMKQNQELQTILQIEDENTALKKFKQYIQEDHNLKSLLKIYPIIISTNISCSKLGSANTHFDLCIMDEASQCSTALSLLPLARAKRCLLVGDQNQLQPITTIDPKQHILLKKIYDIPTQYDYENSILNTMLLIDPISKFILLKKHYRCDKNIIQFSNQKYYDNQLEIMTKANKDSLKLINVKGNAKQKNTSLSEIHAILEEIKQNPNQEIAIITPFRNQSLLIQEYLKQYNNTHIPVGTIHTFQGNEKDHIIISSGITTDTKQGSFDWIKNNQELINVGCTRAKKKLTLITDIETVLKLSKNEKNDFLQLIEYMQSKGNSIIEYKENILFDKRIKNSKYFSTKAEDEFLNTILHFKTTINTPIEVHQKVKISDVLDLSHDEQYLFHYGNQAHFDFVLYNQKSPILAIEICGPEHYNNEKVKERDQKKKQIAKNHELALITIRNDYVRRYNYIRKAILNIFK